MDRNDGQKDYLLMCRVQSCMWTVGVEPSELEMLGLKPS